MTSFSTSHNVTFAAPTAMNRTPMPNNSLLSSTTSNKMNRENSISLLDLTSTRRHPAHVVVERNSMGGRNSSDSALASVGGPASYNRVKTFNTMFSRSGGKTVSLLIHSIHERCAEREQSQTTVPVAQAQQAPEEELCTLAQWSADSYYKIVMVSRQGIPAILRAMKCFPENRAIQECGCICVSNLCIDSPKQQVIIEDAGGVQQIILAMKHHPQSIAVQSAACDALRSLSGLLLVRAKEDTTNVAEAQVQTEQLLQVLGHAKEMYLHPVHLSIAQELFVAMASLSCSASQA